MIPASVVFEFWAILLGLVGSVISLAVTIGYMLTHPSKGGKPDDDYVSSVKKQMDKWKY